MNPTRVIVIAVLLLTLVVGCQSQPEAPPSTEQLTAYAEAVRSRQIADLTQFRQCYALGGEISEQVADTREAWQFRHGSLFAAADAQLQRSRTDWITLDQQVFSLQSLQTLKNIAEATREQLNLAQRGVAGQKNVCQRAMASIESRGYGDLFPGQRVVDALLAQPTKLTPTSPGTELQFNEYARATEPGRSFFTVTESLQAVCSGQLVVETLVNDWPEEDYGAFCQGEPLYHIHCEWGECQQYRPETTPQ